MFCVAESDGKRPFQIYFLNVFTLQQSRIYPESLKRKISFFVQKDLHSSYRKISLWIQNRRLLETHLEIILSAAQV